MQHGTTKFLALLGVATLGVAGMAFAPTAERLALPGDLPAPLSQMTSGQLFAAGAAIRFDNGPVQARECDRGACQGRIDAVSDQVPGPGSISANGTIVARLVNLGRADGGDDGLEARYRMARGQNEYYLIAIKAGDRWAWTVREAVRGGDGAPRETASGAWTTCRHDPNNPAHPKGRSQFASCSAGAGDDDLERLSGPSVAVGESTLSAFPPRDPGWISCTDGCCTAGA